MVVLDPLALELTNWAERYLAAPNTTEACQLPALPHGKDDADVPQRHFGLGRHVWIEREDFEETPPKGYKRLLPATRCA